MARIGASWRAMARLGAPWRVLVRLVTKHVSDIQINAGDNIITCSTSEKLLGVHIDNTFEI